MENIGKDFENYAKKIKRKRWILTGLLSFIICICILAGLYKLNSTMMQKKYFETDKIAENYMLTQAPNIYANNRMVREGGLFQSQIHMDTYKNIDGYRVSWQPIEFPFSTIFGGATYDYKNSADVEDRGALYTQATNQKTATFFSPLVKGDKSDVSINPTKEAKLLKGMKNTLGEVAISFNKLYSYDEIQSMIPKNVLINWYWAGMKNEENEKSSACERPVGLSPVEENSAKLSDEDFIQFKKALKTIDGKGITVNGTHPIQQAKDLVESYNNLKSAKFAGVIVTGTTENLSTLDNYSWSFATNTGVIVQERGDIQPIVK